MKNISDLNIYPLNEENLQALLDYFFPHLPKGDVKDLCEELIKYDLTLMELEYVAIKNLPYISKIKDMLGIDLSKCVYIDSAFFGAIIVASKKLIDIGYKLKVVEPGVAGEYLFTYTNTVKIFDKYKTREEAIKSFEEDIQPES